MGIGWLGHAGVVMLATGWLAAGPVSVTAQTRVPIESILDAFQANFA